MRYAACIEMLFTECDDPAKRLQLAKDAGFDGVEFWLWRNKHLATMKQALDATGLTLCAVVVDPILPLTDPAQRPAFLSALQETIETATYLGAKGMIVQAGDEQTHLSRAEQHQSIIDALTAAVPLLEQSELTLMLEPLNTKVDHPGYYLSSSREGFEIIRQVNHPQVRLLFDMYHAVMMNENPEQELQNNLEFVAHIHLADAPGRQEPGTGRMPYRTYLQFLKAHNYSGYVGLEFRPSVSTKASLGFLRELADV